MNVEKATERVRAEFEEMPGLVLTMPQASRFFGLEHHVAQAVLERLVNAAYLRWTPAGAITRAVGQ